MFCSAINISKKRPGYFAWNISAYVEFLTSPSNETNKGYFSPSLARALPYALRVAAESPVLYLVFGIWTVVFFLFLIAGAALATSPRRFKSTFPNSFKAFTKSSGASGLPCQPSLFSIKETPLPLTVLAMMTVGCLTVDDWIFWKAWLI